MQIIIVKNKKVGFVSGNTFFKRVKASKHFLKKPPAIAFDVVSLDIAMEYGADKIRVLDTENDVIYSATIQDVLTNGWEINYKNFGKQVAMVKSKWDTSCRLCDQKQKHIGREVCNGF